MPLILFGLTSCVIVHPIQESKFFHIIENVPFYPQEAYQCGPASLAEVLNYWGINVTPEEIVAEIYSNSARGTLNLDMIIYVEIKGLKASYYKGSLEDIRRKIDLGYPLIVLVDLGFWIYQQNHFMVIIGYDEDQIIAHSGKEKLKRIPVESFLKSWERTNHWTLLISPP